MKRTSEVREMGEMEKMMAQGELEVQAEKRAKARRTVIRTVVCRGSREHRESPARWSAKIMRYLTSRLGIGVPTVGVDVASQGHIRRQGKREIFL